VSHGLVFLIPLHVQEPSESGLPQVGHTPWQSVLHTGWFGRARRIASLSSEVKSTSAISSDISTEKQRGSAISKTISQPQRAQTPLNSAETLPSISNSSPKSFAINFQRKGPEGCTMALLSAGHSK